MKAGGNVSRKKGEFRKKREIFVENMGRGWVNKTDRS